RASEALADCCVLTAMSAVGPPLMVRTHRDPRLTEATYAVALRHPYGPAASHGMAEVIRSGKPEIHTLIDDEYAENIADDLLRELCRELELGSAMTVPLPGATGRVGAILLEIGRASCRERG